MFVPGQRKRMAGRAPQVVKSDHHLEVEEYLQHPSHVDRTRQVALQICESHSKVPPPGGRLLRVTFSFPRPAMPTTHIQEIKCKNLYTIDMLFCEANGHRHKFH